MELSNLEKELKKPFLPGEIEWRITAKSGDKTKGLVVPYITNRAIQNRLDEVCGIENWKNEFFICPDNSKICGISIKIKDEWITKYDGASDTDIEATKGGISNAMKRAAVQWGIGRYLYNLPSHWVKIKPQGKNYIIDDKLPELPSWALPENIKPTVNKKWKPAADKKLKKELPEAVEQCIDSFKLLNISKAELENYLHLEADMFTDNDIETLRTVYQEIKIGRKTKEDYFFTDTSSRRGQQTLKLEKTLLED